MEAFEQCPSCKDIMPCVTADRTFTSLTKTYDCKYCKLRFTVKVESTEDNEYDVVEEETETL